MKKIGYQFILEHAVSRSCPLPSYTPDACQFISASTALTGCPGDEDFVLILNEPRIDNGNIAAAQTGDFRRLCRGMNMYVDGLLPVLFVLVDR